MEKRLDGSILPFFGSRFPKMNQEIKMQISASSSIFRGDINESISLGDVLETLSSRKKTGWLFLQRENQEVYLYIKGDLIGLVTVPESKFRLLPEKLHHIGKLSQADCKKAKEIGRAHV